MWLSLTLMATCLSILSPAQGSKQLWDTVTAIQNNKKLKDEAKLGQLHHLENDAPRIGYSKDSSYARLFHAIAVSEYLINKDYNAALEYTRKAIETNLNSKSGFSPILLSRSSYNLAYFYDEIGIFKEALQFYDTAIERSSKLAMANDYILDSRLGKAYIYFRMGDYQKAVEEASLGLQIARLAKDSSHCAKLLNQRAQSLFFQNRFDESLTDLDEAIMLAKRTNDPFQVASAYKMMGFIYSNKRDFSKAASYYQSAINERSKTEYTGQVAGDYNDFGNFYRDSIKNYINSDKCYLAAIKVANKVKDSVRLARIHVNLAESKLRRDDFESATNYIQKAFTFLKIGSGPNSLNLTSASRISSVGNKELIFALLQVKTDLLLKQFKRSQNLIYLNACIQMTMIGDSVLTQARHEQIGETSKLYWRDKTRGFFESAIEAAFLGRDTFHVYYFMEKSRAVLLNDKLQELGAFAHLPTQQTETERKLQTHVITEQLKLNSLPAGTKEFQEQQVKLFTAHVQLEQFIKTLDKNYPAYYQYKYAEEVPSLQQLHQYLSGTGQAFVHFFNGDSAIYSMVIEAGSSRLIKMDCSPGKFGEIEAFIQLCSNKEKLNANYDVYAKMAFDLYKLLFDPLKIKKGRTIICEDNYLLPFDAFCSDSLGKNFLLRDYSFSYVYSAGNLLKKSNLNSSSGNFIGFAPVHFESSLNVADLSHSQNSLETTAREFNNKRVLLGVMSSRKNFLQQISGFSIATVYSHARADSSDAEPVLYMQDSVIHLSELQLLHEPATKLVVLGACQTNVGKVASGEGIFSLARGFASAGIPTVAATLWNAEEKAVYSISEKFHKNIAQGMEIDRALQKAKLDYLESDGAENHLPYLWANIIVIGNAEPISFIHTPKRIFWSLLPELIAILAIIMFVLLRFNKNRKGTMTS